MQGDETLIFLRTFNLYKVAIAGTNKQLQFYFIHEWFNTGFE